MHLEALEALYESDLDMQVSLKTSFGEVKTLKWLRINEDLNIACDYRPSLYLQWYKVNKQLQRNHQAEERKTKVKWNMD